jgi:hypothetical protein
MPSMVPTPSVFDRCADTLIRRVGHLLPSQVKAVTGIAYREPFRHAFRVFISRPKRAVSRLVHLVLLEPSAWSGDADRKRAASLQCRATLSCARATTACIIVNTPCATRSLTHRTLTHVAVSCCSVLICARPSSRHGRQAGRQAGRHETVRSGR